MKLYPDLSFYDQDYFDQGLQSGKSNYVDYFWERIGSEVEKTAAHIIKHFSPVKTLDVGCAKGFMVKALYERGVDAYGIDASEYAISKASETLTDRVKLGLASDLPYENEEFDLVTIFDVLEHIPEELALKTCAELLRVSGKWVLAYVVTEHEPDDIDPTHINIKPLRWWEAIFTGLGGKLHSAADIFDPGIWWFNLIKRLILVEKQN
jgi:2-polyprenyl-3-methyl-5-hydroxy-6-metoxy-1,4-benzoquinol methylase